MGRASPEGNVIAPQSSTEQCNPRKPAFRRRDGSTPRSAREKGSAASALGEKHDVVR